MNFSLLYNLSKLSGKELAFTFKSFISVFRAISRVGETETE